MKNNNVYEAPEALVVCLEATDVITSSFVDADVIPDGWIEA